MEIYELNCCVSTWTGVALGIGEQGRRLRPHILRKPHFFEYFFNNFLINKIFLIRILRNKKSLLDTSLFLIIL